MLIVLNNLQDYNPISTWIKQRQYRDNTKHYNRNKDDTIQIEEVTKITRIIKQKD